MITQAKFSKSVKFFEKGFFDRWNLYGYHNRHASCFFAGVYSKEDVKIINAHKGFKVVWNPGRKKDLFENLNNDIIVMIGNGIEANGYTKRLINKYI